MEPERTSASAFGSDAHRSNRPPAAAESSEANRKRIVEYKDYKEENRGKTYEAFESDFFVLWRGMDNKRAGMDAFEPEFTPRVLTYMDEIWCFYRDALGFPMPWSDKKRQAFYQKAEPAFHKINVYLTETGLSKHKKGWANGASAIQIHPRALGGGSSVIVHEMGHVMQLYSGGMQNWSPVGSFWETHANWQTHQFIPSFVGGQKQYFDDPSPRLPCPPLGKIGHSVAQSVVVAQQTG